MDSAEQQRLENLGVISEAIQKKVKEARAEGYLEGYKAALRRYAHWHDGVLYVGSCGTTLQRALLTVEAELRR